MPPPLRPPLHLPPTDILIAEVALFLVVTLLSILIYHKTKEIYDLTKHDGIKHFRNIFLYFALAYLFRLGHIFLIFVGELPRHVRGFSLLFVGYFSTMAILSLAMTVVTRHFKFNNTTLLLHAIALLASIFVFITRSHPYLVIFQTILFAIALLFVFIKSHKAVSSNRVTYILLFLFWIINIIAFTRSLLPLRLRIPLYVVSSLVFLWVYLRVKKRFVHGKTR